MRRDIEIKVRLSKDELAKLTRNVKKTSLSREGYIRTLLRGYEPQSEPTEEYYEAVKEIRRISAELKKLSFVSGAEYSSAYSNLSARLIAACDQLQYMFLPKERA